MVTTYNALKAFAPMQSGLRKYDMQCVSNDKFSFLILCQPDTIFFVAYCKLSEDKQCQWPNRADTRKQTWTAWPPNSPTTPSPSLCCMANAGTTALEHISYPWKTASSTTGSLAVRH